MRLTTALTGLFPSPAKRLTHLLTAPPWRLIASATLAGLMTTTAMAQDARPTPPLPPIRIQSPEARWPVRVQRVVVQTDIVGLAAATRVELELFNPNPQDLVAEVQFPLLEGQAVTRFALDINGVLRAAVPVEKAMGRQVFEDVVRGRVDPGLLEATPGNQYKLLVYPLPGKGSRRVALEIRETLAASARPIWRLPLQWTRGADSGAVEVDVRVAGVEPRAVTAQWGAERFKAKALAGGSQVAFARGNGPGLGELRIGLPATPTAAVVGTETFKGQRYFHADVPLPEQAWPRPAPQRVALVWDASASGARRDHARELALLDAWFRHLRTVEVQLVVVRHEAEPAQTFTVQHGDWQALRQHLESLAYDGATRLKALLPPTDADLAVVFSDGLGNWGTDPLPTPSQPTVAVVAASSDAARTLRHAAEASGGAFVDLLSTPTARALRQLTHTRSRLVSAQAEGARDLEWGSAYPRGNRFDVAGVFTQPEARVVLTFSSPNGTPYVRTLSLTADTAAPATRLGVAAYRWADWRLTRLEADRERQRQAIRRLGMEFGLASTETSLIVLDTVADYVRYDIEPPPELRVEWESQTWRRTEIAQRRQQASLARIAERFAEKVAWWERDFPKDTPPPPSVAPGSSGVPAPVTMARAATAAPPTPESSPPGVPVITLRKWQPDEPYARRLRAAPADDLYAIYLDERPGYAQSSAFYLDVADILNERGQPALALRVLSNLAEMDLENRHLLRILAYRLLQGGQVVDALPVLEQVLRLAPDEPQSYRDLGLALAQASQPQRAVDTLWEVVARPWNDRFPDIELIALAELNAIAARAEAAGQPLKLDRIDPRLRRNLPLDLRAVLNWDADNTDIDLWVIDPNGERAYYGRRLTYQGGRMSRDFVGGYGPEEFSLKTAKPGTYTVKAQFYGHRQQIVAPATTLMLRLSTGFGTPGQKDQDTVLRLQGRGSEVTVGTFTVGNKP